MRAAANQRDIFGRNLQARARLIALRTRGVSCVSIGRDYFNGMDHTTVLYNLKRFAPHLIGMQPQKLETPEIELLKPEVEVLPRRVSPSDKYDHLISDECVYVNPGKPYAQYRKISVARSKARTAYRVMRLKKEYQERIKRRGFMLNSSEMSFVKNAITNSRLNIKTID